MLNYLGKVAGGKVSEKRRKKVGGEPGAGRRVIYPRSKLHSKMRGSVTAVLNPKENLSLSLTILPLVPGPLERRKGDGLGDFGV